MKKLTTFGSKLFKFIIIIFSVINLAALFLFDYQLPDFLSSDAAQPSESNPVEAESSDNENIFMILPVSVSSLLLSILILPSHSSMINYSLLNNWI